MIAAITMVRDEADVIRETVGHMLTQVDQVYVADNNSVDETRGYLEDFVAQGAALEIIDDRTVAYRQSQKMSRLAARAREEGATWVVPFDADEIWSARSGKRIADDLAYLATLDLQIDLVEADVYDYVATARDDLSLPAVERMKWRRGDKLPLPKAAFVPYKHAVVYQGNHGVAYSHNEVPLRLGGLVHVAHFPYRSAEQVIRKIRNGAQAYAADPHIRSDYGGHWRSWGQILEAQGEQAIVDLWRKWHFRTHPSKYLEMDGDSQPPLVLDPVKVCSP